jgi:hypothetical protein
MEEKKEIDKEIETLSYYQKNKERILKYNRNKRYETKKYYRNYYRLNRELIAYSRRHNMKIKDVRKNLGNINLNYIRKRKNTTSKEYIEKIYKKPKLIYELPETPVELEFYFN